MSMINGDSNANSLPGTQAGDTISGGRGNDTVSGLRGDDVLLGGRGNDLLIGGNGNDVLIGGLDSDTFMWAASHIEDGGVDYITDFAVGTDKLAFMPNAAGTIKIMSVEAAYLEVEEANGVSLSNNLTTGTDLTFTIMNETTGDTQTIVLLDAWSGNLSNAWNDYLLALGFTGGISFGAVG